MQSMRAILGWWGRDCVGLATGLRLPTDDAADEIVVLAMLFREFFFSVEVSSYYSSSYFFNKNIKIIIIPRSHTYKQ